MFVIKAAEALLVGLKGRGGKKTQHLLSQKPFPPCRVNSGGVGGVLLEDKPLVARRRSHDLEEEAEEEDRVEEPCVTQGQPGGEGRAEEHVGGATELNCKSSPPRSVTFCDLQWSPN